MRNEKKTLYLGSSHFFIGFLFSPPPYIHTLLADDILPIPYDDLLWFLCLLVFDGHTRELADEDVHAVFGRVHLSRDDARFRRPLLLVVGFLVVGIHFFRTISSKRARPFFADMSRIWGVDVSRGQFVGVKVHCNSSWLLVACVDISKKDFNFRVKKVRKRLIPCHCTMIVNTL